MIDFQEIKNTVRGKRKEITILSILFLLFLFFAVCIFRKSFLKKEKEPETIPLSSSDVIEKKLHFKRDKDSFIYYRPGITIYNLYYEKNAENSSIGENIYKEMMNLDSKYLAKILDEAGETPEKVAKVLGLKRSRIMGKYNPEVQGENADSSASYPIPYFKNIHYRFINGDGQEMEDDSNVKDILSLASVYTYKHNYLDTELFLAICKELYEKSHSYSLSISPVYFDQGCVNFTPKEEETVSSSKNSSMNNTGKEEQSLASASEIEKGETEEEQKEPAMENRTSTEGDTASEKTSSMESDIVSEKNTSTGSGTASEKTMNGNTSKKNYCPGHVDLTITIQVKKFTDQNGLKEIPLSCLEKDREQDKSPFSRWKGWNEECNFAVKTLMEKDWFSEYGLSLSTVETKTPLSEEEISRYMSLLPTDLSEERKKLIHFALEAVGKVPYYYGGKASKQGFDGNRFGKTIGERDYKGRNKKGLDCSGFIQWAYWSGVDNPLDFVSSTKELIGIGNKINRSDLVPGDLIIQPDGESHVVMFLSWTEEGKMLAIHENATAGTISVDEVSANYPYYRSILP